MTTQGFDAVLANVAIGAVGRAPHSQSAARPTTPRAVHDSETPTLAADSTAAASVDQLAPASVDQLSPSTSRTIPPELLTQSPAQLTSTAPPHIPRNQTDMTDTQRPEAQQPNSLDLPGSWSQPMEEPSQGRAHSGRPAPCWQDHEERIMLAFMQTIKQHQPVPWGQLRQHIPGRSFDSIRQRWALLRKREGQLERTKEGREQLDEPSSKVRVALSLGEFDYHPECSSSKRKFTEAEDMHIMEQHALLGGKWRKIAGGLPRDCSESSVRSRYKHLLKKRAKQEVEQYILLHVLNKNDKI